MIEFSHLLVVTCTASHLARLMGRNKVEFGQS